MATPQLKVDVVWRAALKNQSPQQGYEYPEKTTNFFRSCYTGPAVYRWRIHPGQDGGRQAVYVGETENLAQRVQGYRTPTKNPKYTDRRLKVIFDEATKIGKHVFLDIADFEPFELNGVLITRGFLDDKFKRCLIENLCICTLENQGCQSLNRRLEPASAAEKRFRSLSPGQKRKALGAVASQKKEPAQD